jgi:hypothetical protein
MQRRNNKALRAPITTTSTATSNQSGNSSRALRRCQQQEELNAQQNTTSLILLVNSIKELAECQQQMILEQVKERNNERQIGSAATAIRWSRAKS